MSKFVFLKSLRELLVPLKHLIDKKAENVNWNENDPAAKGYIANRPFYKEVKEKYIVKNAKIELLFVQGNIGMFKGPVLKAKNGDVLTVVWDGVEYKCKVGTLNGPSVLGNKSIASDMFGTEFPDTGEPFLWAFDPMGEAFSQICTLELNDHVVSCFGDVPVVHKIPSEYLPEISSVGKEGTGEGAEIFNDYENNSASGKYAHAEGCDTIASGHRSHAEGWHVTAYGRESHAEGYRTEALGECSHAEGQFSVASELSSHAEGQSTTANAYASHSEGMGTLASSPQQHVQGKYNIEDSAGKYAHIVGNGVAETHKNNAHTLDWNGLGWFAGGLKVGGTGQDDEDAEYVATKSDLIAPKREIGLIVDQVTGNPHIITINNGNLATRSAVKFIKIATLPTKTEYMVGDYLDTAGMTIIGELYDGSSINIDNYEVQQICFSEEQAYVNIYYFECGLTHKTTLSVNVIPFDPTIALIDFEYAKSSDGTYGIIGWKGTHNGKPSTELIIPNNNLVKL